METDLFSGTSNLYLSLAFLLSAGLAFMIVPSIRAVARRWSLYDFNIRHEVTLSHIPRHGGIALVVAFGVSAAVFAPVGVVPGVRYLLATCLLLLAAGIQDDLLHLSQFMRILFVVAAGSIITDVAGMNLFYTGIGRIFNYPLADLLITYLLFVGCVLLALQASKIPGMLSLILLVCSVDLAISAIFSGLPGMAVIPLALAGASLVLFFSALGNFVFEGRTSALAGGFLLVVHFISSMHQQSFSFSLLSVGVFFFTMFVLPILVALGTIRIENGKIYIFNLGFNHRAFFVIIAFLLLILCLF